MDKRVKYYPQTDLLFGHNLFKIEELKIPAFESIDINDAIEFFQIKRYFDTKTRSKDWSDEDYEKYKSKSDELSGLSKRFFNQIDDDNIIDYYGNIELGYHSSFWVLFDNCKLYNKISNVIFELLINGEKISPYDLFLHKNIVCKYGNILRKYIMQNGSCITILLHVYEQNYTRNEKLLLPIELTGEDICNCIESYIDGENPNTNYLRTIVDMRCTSEFPITDEIRLKAKRRYETELKNICKTGAIISHGIQISFNPEQEEVKIATQHKSDFSISYSKNWLLDTLDFPSILNNFIYVFEFVDFPQMRSTHVNKDSQSGVFERVLASKSSKVYTDNFAFNFSNRIASLQMYMYYDFLAKQNIRLEDVIEWFFTKQIQTEFGCPEIRLSMPSSNSSYIEKCSTIITAFESVLKQYSLYVKHNEIDFELVEMSTTPILFSNVKSMVTDKYLYGVGEDYKWLSYWLFSDQCTFSFIERIRQGGKKYDCLTDLLLNELVYISDYRKEEHWAFEKMKNYDLVAINTDGRITIKDKVKLAILRDLFQNDVINKWHYPPDAIEDISYFINKGILEAKNTLFSQPEIDYLNFLLNRSEYSNGLELRNRYIHGVKQVVTNENEHQHNYFVFLRIFILLAIKVNDDFCLRESNTQKEFELNGISN